MPAAFFQNDAVRRLVPDVPHHRESVRRIADALTSHGTLVFTPLATGLYPASPGGGSSTASGYANVWVRDNVYVAYAHHVTGRQAEARATLDALLTFFERSRARFEGIIEGRTDATDVHLRPHIRFNGDTLTEITTERWAHAENDALGYFLWLYANLASSGVFAADTRALDVLTRLVAYFGAIRYWEDEDSGHWEETRKISASSIGVVVAGLRAYARLLDGLASLPRAHEEGRASVQGLILRGEQALSSILPAECVQLSPAQNRRYDAALLPLVYPLGLVTGVLADVIVHDVTRYLQGPHGIRRYLGDSYWAPDYDTHLTERDRTRDFSDDVGERDRLLPYVGQEAQWCLFDPLLSAYFGLRYRETGDRRFRAQQNLHFNRSLAQITPDWKCPELYYCKDGRWIANPHVPLLWTQANLVLALTGMEASLNPYSACPPRSR